MSHYSDIARRMAARFESRPDDKPQWVSRRQAVVLEVRHGETEEDIGTLTIEMGGSTIPGVHFLDSYFPREGDVVFVEIAGGDPLVVGQASTSQVPQSVGNVYIQEDQPTAEGPWLWVKVGVDPVELWVEDENT